MGKYDALFSSPDTGQAQGKYSALFDQGGGGKYDALFDDSAPTYFPQTVLSDETQPTAGELSTLQTPEGAPGFDQGEAAYKAANPEQFAPLPLSELVRQKIMAPNQEVPFDVRGERPVDVSQPEVLSPEDTVARALGFKQFGFTDEEAGSIAGPIARFATSLRGGTPQEAEDLRALGAKKLQELGTPENVALALATGGGGPLATAAEVAFAGQGGAGAYDAAQRFANAQTPEEKNDALSDFMLSAAMTLPAVSPIFGKLRGKPAVPLDVPSQFNPLPLRQEPLAPDPPPTVSMGPGTLAQDVSRALADRQFTLVPEPRPELAPAPSVEQGLAAVANMREPLPFNPETPPFQSGVDIPLRTETAQMPAPPTPAPGTPLQGRLLVGLNGETPAADAAAQVQPEVVAPSPLEVPQEAAVPPLVTPGDERYANVTTPSPATVTEPVSTRNAAVEAARSQRSLDPIVSEASQDLGTAWDKSAQELAQDPGIGRRLVDQFKAAPGAADDVMNAHLLREQIKRQAEYDTAVKLVNDSEPGSPENALAQERLAHASQDYYDVHQADRNAGTGTGRGLNARKMLADDQYTLAKIEARRRAANGGDPLNPQQAAETTMAAAKLNDLRQKSAAADDVARKAALDAEMKRVRTDIDRQVTESATKGSSFWDDLEAKAKARIRERAGRVSAGVDPTVLVDVAQIGAAKIAKGIKSFDAWSSQMLAELGDWIKPHLDDLYKRAQDLVKRYQPNEEKRSFAPTGSMAEAIKEFNRQDVYKVRTLKATEALKEKLAAQDYTKAQRNKIKLDRQAENIRAEYQKVKNDVDRAIRKDQLRNRPRWQKILDTFVKVERGMKLAGLTIYPKLAAAAATRIGTRPLEQAVQSVLGQVPGLRRIHEAAPLSGFSPSAEGAALAGIIKGAKEFPRRIMGGHAPESELYAKPELEPRSWLDLPATTHAAIKAPVEEAERARATRMLQDSYQKQGKDLSDPRVRQEIGQLAEVEAKRSIFLQDNVISNGWKSFLNSMESSKKFPVAGKIGATVGKFLLPIVRVPTNIAIEAGIHMPGIGQIAPTAKLLQVMRRGIETIQPEEADMIMRHYSKGAIGAGLFFSGYFMAANGQMSGFYQPGKRQPGAPSPMTIRIGGVEIPAWLMHAPAFLVMQAGATFYNAAHHVDKYGKPDQSAVLRTAKGLATEVPFVKEMGTLDGLLSDEYQGRKVRGQLASGTFVPQFVRNIAQFTDPLKQPAYRSPQSTLDYVRKDIPGLREQVRVKGVPSTIPLTQQQQYRQLLKSQGIKPPKSLKQLIKEQALKGY